MASSQRYEVFMALHTQPGGFVMPNAWDGLSALILKKAGFAALGTSSAAFAAALGRLDGRHAVSRSEHLARAQLLARVSGLPINGDFEDGYGDTPADVAATVKGAIDAGLAGGAAGCRRTARHRRYRGSDHRDVFGRNVEPHRRGRVTRSHRIPQPTSPAIAACSIG